MAGAPGGCLRHNRIHVAALEQAVDVHVGTSGPSGGLSKHHGGHHWGPEALHTEGFDEGGGPSVALAEATQAAGVQNEHECSAGPRGGVVADPTGDGGRPGPLSG